MADAPDSSRRRSGTSWNAVDLLLAGIGFGLVTGGLEAVIHTIRRHVLNQTVYLGRDFFWTLPLADAAIFLVAALLLRAAGAAMPRLRRPSVGVGAFAGLSAFALLLLTERIHVAAEAFLGLAVAVAVGRLASSRVGPIRRVTRVFVPAALALVAVSAAASRLGAGWLERRGMAALPAATPGRPNILLLVLDTVRAWNLSLYGYSRPTTPKLAEWARRGVLFERTLAPAPWTTLSHAVMFTGRQPSELSVRWDRPLDGTHPTLAGVLGGAGYATAGFVGNYTQAGRTTGLALGFLHYDDYPVTPISILRRTALLRRVAARERVGALVGRRRMLEGRTSESVNGSFLRWLDRDRGGRPWFAFLNYYEAHAPYLPPVPYDTVYFGRPDAAVRPYWDRLLRAYGAPPVPVEILSESLDAYDGAITYLDREVDALLGAVAARGQLENTVVIVTSDHGELFGEHGTISHGNNLYLPVLYVPLLVIAPGRAPGGVRVPSVASLRDLPNTLLDLAGVASSGLPGRSLVPSWGPGGGASLPSDTVFAMVEFNRRLPTWPPSPVLRGTLQSVVLDSLQYILTGGSAEELFHLGRDPWQTRNLAPDPGFRADLSRHRDAMRGIPGQGRLPGVPMAGF